MVRKKVIVVTLCLLVILATSLMLQSGCGEGEKETTEDEISAPVGGTTPTGYEHEEPITDEDAGEPEEDESSGREQSDEETSEEELVTQAAIADAHAKNPGLPELKVMGINIIGNWARVDLEPVDRSTDVASWLLKKSNGTWTVIDWGTAVLPEAHPDAPPELFQ